MILEKLMKRPVVTVSEQSSLQQAAQRMRDAHVGDVIVTSTKEGLEIPVGVLTDRDIVMSTIALGIDPTAMRVEDVMSPSLVVASIHDSLARIVDLMKEHGVKRIPLVNKQDEVEGIVSSDDVIALLAAELSAISSIPLHQRRNEQSRRRKFA